MFRQRHAMIGEVGIRPNLPTVSGATHELLGISIDRHNGSV